MLKYIYIYISDNVSKKNTVGNTVRYDELEDSRALNTQRREKKNGYTVQQYSGVW